jgi:hypothetical protein
MGARSHTCVKSLAKCIQLGNLGVVLKEILHLTSASGAIKTGFLTVCHRKAKKITLPHVKTLNYRDSVTKLTVQC